MAERLPADGSTSFLTIAQGNLNARPVDSASASISADGRFVAFLSYAPLAGADTNTRADIYVLDRSTGGVSLETPEHAASPFDNALSTPQLSGNGQLLVYVASPGLERAGAAALRTIMVRDRTIGITRALFTAGTLPNGDCRDPRITADGRTVVFASSATNLVDIPDANGSAEDVFVVDVTTMAVRRVSVDSAGRQMATGASFAAATSDDARYVVFSSTAALDGSKGRADEGRPRVEVYCRDMRLGLTTKISEAPKGVAANGSSYDVAISADGRFVAFVSDATNLAGPRDRNRSPDIYLRDTVTGVTSLASRSDHGSANGPSRRPALSADGSVLVFQSDASDLTCGPRCRAEDRDINLVSDIFAVDRVAGTIRRVSAGRTAWMEPSIGPVVDGSGSVIAFSSRRPRHGRDDGDDYDLFVRAPGR